MKSQEKRKSPASILIPLNRWGESLIMRESDPNSLIQFTIVGPRGGVRGTAFIKAEKLREVGRAAIRLANEVEGKTGFRSIKGGKRA